MVLQKHFFLILFFAFQITVSAQTQPYPGGSGQYVKLVWQDEFGNEGLVDSTKWGYEKGYVRNKE
jgi:hypothetical protein